MDAPQPNREKKRYLLCFSPKDAEGKDELVAHLAVVRASLVVWSVDEVPAGGQVSEEFRRIAAGADVALLLLSADFFAELHKEPLAEQVGQLRQQHAERTLRLIPLVWRDCDWQAVAWLAALKPLPVDGTALRAMDPAQRDRAFTKIARQLDGRHLNREAADGGQTHLGRSRWGFVALACLAVAIGSAKVITGWKPEALPASLPSDGSISILDRTSERTIWKVEGLVRDRRHEPLPGVTVSLPELTATTLTNDQGYFRFALQTDHEGLVLLRAEQRAISPSGKPSYRAQEVHVNLGSTNLDLVLEDNR